VRRRLPDEGNRVGVKDPGEYGFAPRLPKGAVALPAGWEVPLSIHGFTASADRSATLAKAWEWIDKQPKSDP
jgi:hypothetical protein